MKKHWVGATWFFVLLPITAKGFAAPESVVSIQNSLESTAQQAQALERMARIPIFASQNTSQVLSPTGFSHDTARSRSAIDVATKHLLFNDNQRALDIAEQAYRNTSSDDIPETNSLLKIIYESSRKLGRTEDALKSCSQFIARSMLETNLLLSCSHTIMLASQKNMEGNVLLSRHALSGFAYAQSVRKLLESSLQPAILISAAFENMGLESEAYNYLERALATGRSSDAWAPRINYVNAIRDLKTGRTEKARETLLSLSQKPDTDSLTKLMAKQSLARILIRSGQYDAAEVLYKEAISTAQTLPTEVAQTSVAVGDTASTLPNSLNAVFPTQERTELVSEYAATLCARKKFEECESAYKKIFSMNPLRSHANIVFKSGFLRTQSQDQITALLGESNADLQFTLKQTNIEENLTNLEFQNRARALLKLSRIYGSTSPNVARLVDIESQFETAEQEAKSLNSSLTASISALRLSQGTYLPQRYQNSQKELDALSTNLLSAAVSLSKLSMEHWDSQNGALSEATEHQAALLARLAAQSDGLSRIDTLVQKNKENKKLENLALQESNAIQTAFANIAAANATAFVAKNLAQESSKNAVSELLSKSIQIAEKLAPLQFELRIATLKQSQRSNREFHLSIAQATLSELHELHKRMHRAPQNNAERTALNNVRQTWKKLDETAGLLAESYRSLERQGNTERSQLLNAVLRLRDRINENTEKFESINKNLAHEMRAGIKSAAFDLLVSVRTFHDNLRIAIANTDLRAIEDTELGRLKLARAAEERSRWMTSLQKTLEWELGR